MALSLSSPSDVLDGLPLVPPPEHSYLPARAYVSEAVFAVEMREVFPRSWVFVGDTHDLARPGDFVTTSIGYEPVLAIRGDDDEIRAFSNVCPHRAALVAEGVGNCGARLNCPYHGWSFRSDGSFATAPLSSEYETPLDPDEMGLRPLRVDTWGPFVFVNVSGNAPPLAEWLEDAPSALAAHEMHATPRLHRLEDPVEANWKVCYENGIDGYHSPAVHAGSLCLLPTTDRVFRAGRTTASVTSRWEKPPMDFVKDELEGKAREGPIIFNVFPSFIVSAQPSGSFCIYWWRPDALGRSVAGTAGYSIHDDDPRLDNAMVRQVQDEDMEICAKVQTGLGSQLYRPGPRHPRELRVHGFQRWYMEALTAAAAG